MDSLKVTVDIDLKFVGMLKKRTDKKKKNIMETGCEQNRLKSARQKIILSERLFQGKKIFSTG
jgi:hypothetical protein